MYLAQSISRLHVVVGTRFLVGLLLVVSAGCQTTWAPNLAEQSGARAEYLKEFRKIDADGKGAITFDQVTTYYKLEFAKLDLNRDGFLEASEVSALIPVMNSLTPEEFIQRLDRNSDRKLTEAEFLVIANWIFQPARNSNILTLADIENSAPAVSKGGRQGGRGKSGS